MQATQSLTGTFGLPLCISGITSSIPFPNQMEDHDRRRKAVMKRLRSRSRSGSGSGSRSEVVDEIPATIAALSRRDVVDGIPAAVAALSRSEIDGGDLSELIRDLCGSIPPPCAAKAA